MAVDAAAELEFLAAAARRSIGDLRRSVDGVAVQAGGRGEHFIAVVRATLDALGARVQERQNDFAAAGDDAGRDAVIRQMRRTNRDVMAFHSFTPWIASAGDPSLGLGLIYFVRTMVAALLKHSADVITSPSMDYMYETTYKPFAQALSRLGGTYPVGVPPIIVQYPAQEPDSLFLHLIIAHELGHSVIYEENLTDDVYNAAPPSARTLLDQTVTEYESIEQVAAPLAATQVSAILRNWIDEVICDGIATGLLGPSFLLTAATFDTPFGGPRPSPTHPPFNLRTRSMLDRLASWGWRSILEGGVPKAILDWIDHRASVPQDAGTQLYYITLERVLDELAPAIESEITHHLGSDLFQPGDYADDEGLPAGELRELLDHNVLPAQLADGSSADGRAILLAGWLHALAQRVDEPASLVEAVADRDYQRFLAKALEMTTVLEKWRTV